MEQPVMKKILAIPVAVLMLMGLAGFAPSSKASTPPVTPAPSPTPAQTQAGPRQITPGNPDEIFNFDGNGFPLSHNLGENEPLDMDMANPFWQVASEGVVHGSCNSPSGVGTPFTLGSGYNNLYCGDPIFDFKDYSATNYCAGVNGNWETGIPSLVPCNGETYWVGVGSWVVSVGMTDLGFAAGAGLYPYSEVLGGPNYCCGSSDEAYFTNSTSSQPGEDSWYGEPVN
jgi:hypothetical protein